MPTGLTQKLTNCLVFRPSRKVSYNVIGDVLLLEDVKCLAPSIINQGLIGLQHKNGFKYGVVLHSPKDMEMGLFNFFSGP